VRREVADSGADLHFFSRQPDTTSAKEVLRNSREHRPQMFFTDSNCVFPWRMAMLSWPRQLVTYWDSSHEHMVTHSSTNPAQHKAASLIHINVLLKPSHTVIFIHFTYYIKHYYYILFVVVQCNDEDIICNSWVR